MTKYISIISAVFALLAMASCQQSEDAPEVVKERFRIKAYVGDLVSSRTVPRPDDGFSAAGFADGDMAGFYSQGGDRNHGNGAFDNAPMEFTGGFFNGDENMQVDINRVGKTLLYYPYSSLPNGRQPVRDEITGEVKDILRSLTLGRPDDKEYGLVARFSHLFSMLVIQGGYGFENFHQYLDDVSVTLSEPVETIEFRRDDSDDGYSVVLNGEYKDNGTAPAAKYATVKGHYNEEKQAYFVIIPPTDGTVDVNSINVRDDSGRLHKINLWAKLDPGCRYILTLELNELIPSINIHDITLWDGGDGGIELNGKEDKGISNVVDFKNWVEEYNKSPRNEEVLLRYGDKVEVKDASGTVVDKYWRFYLNADIDMSTFDTKEASHLVDMLEDEFDGNGYTMTGLSFTGKVDAALFNIIEGGHACVKNLKVDNLVIDANGSGATGALATELRSGTVSGCTFTDLSMHTSSAVGALAGTIGGGKVVVENCKFSGAIFGKSTVYGVAGSGTVSDDIKKGCDTSNVMFGKIGD